MISDLPVTESTAQAEIENQGVNPPPKVTVTQWELRVCVGAPTAVGAVKTGPMVLSNMRLDLGEICDLKNRFLLPLDPLTTTSTALFLRLAYDDLISFEALSGAACVPLLSTL